MLVQFLCCSFLIVNSGFCENRRSWNKAHGKFVDIYTNHDDFKEVIDNYRNFRKNDRKMWDRDSDELESEFGEIVDTNQDNFVVINTNKQTEVVPNFGTYSGHDETNFNVDNLAPDFVQYKPTVHEIKVEDTLYNQRRPKFKTQENNFTRFSYVQKIPKITEPNSKLVINDMLKNYLGKLYSQKYNTSTKFYTRPNIYKVERDNLKSKLFDDALMGFKNKTVNIANKFFSLFQVVQFSNSQCTATGASGEYQGTCYYSTECSRMNGTAMGNCANGYGVCCVFRNTCGGSSNQNCTYFESPNYPNYYPSNGNDTVVPTTVAPTTTNPSPTPDPRWYYYHGRQFFARQQNDVLSCIFSVYKTNSNITQMRIDFIDLELRSPTNGNCVSERLVISGQNINSQVPVLCGYNTGQHVYVDVSSLNGPLQLSVLSTIMARKRWKIQICQFANSCVNSNCLQYFTGVTGTITSFNYDQASMLNRSSPQYLNNLNYAICIRREAGYCSITYSNVLSGTEYPFQLTNVDDNGNRTVTPGQAGVDVENCPDDYIVIDGVRLCGDKFNDGSSNDNFANNAPVTDTSAGPIVIPVRTDSSVTGIGFKLFYMQNRCSTL